MSDESKRIAVITGSSGGIGRAIVRTLSSDGFTAVGLDLEQGDSGVETVACDVREESSVADAVKRVVEKHGRIDVVVHAAGVSRDGVLWKLDSGAWDEVMAVNLRGAWLLIREVVPVMRQAGAGRVVLIGSINGSRGKVGTSAYSASKAGLIGLAKSASRETGRFGICVNVVEPGWVRTPMTDSAPEELREKAVSETLLGELVEPEDIAAAVGFLCGSGGRRITGQVIRVDAGQYLGAV
jgi:3-oxoacyl-[acyl-carrier protein] reductase